MKKETIHIPYFSDRGLIKLISWIILIGSIIISQNVYARFTTIYFYFHHAGKFTVSGGVSEGEWTPSKYIDDEEAPGKRAAWTAQLHRFNVAWFCVQFQ